MSYLMKKESATSPCKWDEREFIHHKMLNFGKLFDS